MHLGDASHELRSRTHRFFGKRLTAPRMRSAERTGDVRQERGVVPHSFGRDCRIEELVERHHVAGVNRSRRADHGLEPESSGFQRTGAPCKAR